MTSPSHNPSRQIEKESEDVKDAKDVSPKLSTLGTEPEAKQFHCEICNKPGMPITRIGEDGVRVFCSEHLRDYRGEL
jgi:hypothetical protein